MYACFGVKSFTDIFTAILFWRERKRELNDIRSNLIDYTLLMIVMSTNKFLSP